MNVCATTVASWMEEDMVRRRLRKCLWQPIYGAAHERSPWLTQGLAAPEGNQGFDSLERRSLWAPARHCAHAIFSGRG